MLTTRKFIPRLDTLEDRTVPTCTVTQNGTILQITGDVNANTVLINDAGNGNVQTTCDGIVQNFVGIQTINVQTLEGNDLVIYSLTADMMAGQAHSLTADLGDGNDFFLAQALDLGGGNTADLLAGSALSLFAVGGQGNDTLSFDFTKDFDVNTGSAFYVGAYGQQGRDVIALAQLGQVTGSVSLNAFGQKDPDRISLITALDSNSTGSLATLEDGAGGDDLMTLVVSRSNQVTTTVTGQLNGGGGTNRATVSNFVIVSGVDGNNLLRYPF